MRYDVCMKKNTQPFAKKFLPSTLLGGMGADHFLSEYWQKKPLLIRQAIPDFQGLLSPEELAGMACEEDVQSRLITQFNGEWQLEHGPFDDKKFMQLPEADWTLLVQSLNHHMPSAANLLQQFNFIPYARMDDLMVSYAPDQGGVGPHFDSYDVFLLQGQGQRTWRISSQQDKALLKGVPLRILENFTTEQEWLLNPGDMLYLPPQLAHWGIALGPCMTYSIGFRAPSANELSLEFLSFLQEKIAAREAQASPSMYQDADLTLQQNPAEISPVMISKIAKMLSQLQWQSSDIEEFVGKYLSEPGSNIVFDRPRQINASSFAKRFAKLGVTLDLKSQMLFDQDHIFINGEAIQCLAESRQLLKHLADNKSLPAANIDALDQEVLSLLHAWYLAGYLIFSQQ